MSSHLKTALKVLEQPGAGNLLTSIRRGIEKESLRITPQGKLAQTPHPASLGSALTHPSITTDYSEALLEFITPVSTSIDDSLQQLRDIHSFVYQQLEDEILWSASMPCIVSGDEGIPVAQYGSSNVARMKTVYRYGLGHRYGRTMQAIAGIHYNFSMPNAYWEQAFEEAGGRGELQAYITDRYLGLIRNFQRYSWLLIYLFGASPAVCASFLTQRESHSLQPFEPEGKSLHLPHATALRMGDLGYTSNAQRGLNICYNSLENYVQTLSRAIRQTHPAYRSIPCGQNGDYQQLNDSLLQIENEFYSPIRPKRVAASGQTPLNALVKGGIEYIEVRCVDVSPFASVGLDAAQIRFMDTFLLFCLLDESPACDDDAQAAQASNLDAVVNRGREPGLLLQSAQGSIGLEQWACQLLESMTPVAALFDSAHGGDDYRSSLGQQRAKIKEPELTPSARALREMREQGLPFFRLAMSYSERWAEEFRSIALNDDVLTQFRSESEQSIIDRQQIESSDSISFEEYLRRFYAQYQELG
ncbi:MAG: glutamate--cysteine ligase [Pseudomonadota bacterium]